MSDLTSYLNITCTEKDSLNRERNPNIAIYNYLEYVRGKGLSEPVVQKRRCMIAWVCQKLIENNMSPLAQEWNEDTVCFIRDELIRGAPANVCKEYFFTLKKYASFYKNDIFDKVPVNSQMKDSKVKENLTREEINKIMEEAQGVERIIFHMAVQLGLRYTEMLNLRLKDLYYDHLCVLRKDRYGTSLKTIIFHPDTRKELDEYLRVRDAEIDWAKKINKDVEVSDYVFIHQEKGELPIYTVSAVHYMMKKLSNHSNIKFTIKTLKSTNREIAPGIEDRWDLVHGSQETLDTYHEPDVIEEMNDVAVNGDEFLSAVLSTWHNTPKGQEWNAKQKMQIKD